MEAIKIVVLLCGLFPPPLPSLQKAMAPSLDPLPTWALSVLRPPGFFMALLPLVTLYIVNHTTQTDPSLPNINDLIANSRIVKQTSVYCHSLSLITRLCNWCNSCTSYYSSVGLSCDADLCLEIVGIIKQEFQQDMISFHCAKDHQDTKKPHHQLTWPKQLNCNCDHHTKS